MGRYIIAGFALLIAGCGGAAGSAPEFASSAAIQAALNSAGLACSGYEAVASGDRDLAAGGTAADVGRCDLEGENIDMITFKDEGQRDNWAGRTRQMGCIVGQAFGTRNLDYVLGSNWSIADTSQTLSERIADAIGGEAVHVDCSDVKLPGQ